jgi:hypothetical protein
MSEQAEDRREVAVRLPDGSELSVEAGSTVEDVAYAIGPGLGRDAVAGRIDGELVDLATPVPDGADLEIVTEGALRAGRQTVAIEHQGGKLSDVHLVELGGSSTIDNALEFKEDFQLQQPTPVEFRGGAEMSEQGRTTYLTFDLEPGRYAWVSLLYGAWGMTQPFTIPAYGQAGQEVSTSKESVKVDIRVLEHAVIMPAILESGRTALTLKNEGEEPHKMELFRMKEGRTETDFLEWHRAETQAREGHRDVPERPFLGGHSPSWMITDPGSESTITVDLTPDTYVVVSLGKTVNGQFREHEVVALHTFVVEPGE